MGPDRQLVNPRIEPRFTIINGKLIINTPKDTLDNGQYECVASNRYGSVLSNAAMLSFGCQCFTLVTEPDENQDIIFLIDLNDFPKSERDPVSALAYTGVGIECNPPKHSYPSMHTQSPKCHILIML
jgi:hypothetical protein